MILQNKVTLITGGSTGIGFAIVKTFAREGAKIAICGIEKKSIDEAVAELETNGIQSKGYLCNIGNEEEVIRAVKEIHHDFGKIDILINNASVVGQIAPVVELNTFELMNALTVNIAGLVNISREVLKVMIPAGSGNIINISSNVGRRGLQNRAPYVMSKWAMHGFTQTLALETAAQGIRVNGIAPGPVETERLKGAMEEMARARNISVEEIRKEWTSQSPMKRFATTEECAAVCLFLASDASSSMTGQILNVTAGMMMT
jgi:NAD(P)-dependent dehydrogenase (short-subunit alcohol dehydrogenase family)